MAQREPTWTRYAVVWLALMGLTLLSFLLSRAHLGRLDTALSMLIAVGKTGLVLFFFMHLAEERFTIRLVPAVSAALLVLLVSLVVADIATRTTFSRVPLPVAPPAAGPAAPPPPAGG